MLENLPARKDKWYLGSGSPLMWAPRFPLWLDVPGLWDEALYYNYRLAPLFTLSCVDNGGNEIRLNCRSRTWQPSGMTRVYAAGDTHLSIREQTVCLSHNILLSRYTLKNDSSSRRTVSLVFWTVQRGTAIADLKGNKDGIEFRIALEDRGRPSLNVPCRLTLDERADSFSVQSSEGTPVQPRWTLTPFYDTWKERLNNLARVSQRSRDELVFMALHRNVLIEPGETQTVTVMFEVPPPHEFRGKSRNRSSLPRVTPDQSEKEWESHVAGIPHFDCSDEFIRRYYWYRWYGLRLMTLPGGDEGYPHPTVCEGIDYFRAPISYSAQCHMRETRWMLQPDLARGCLLNFIHRQRKNGEFPGYLDVTGERPEMFYHADWGSPVLDVHRIHPGPDFLRRAYDALSRYALCVDEQRDPEGSGLYGIHNHYETGQEFMSRYTAVSPEADADNWGHQFTLKGVDATVYLYRIKKALYEMAVTLDRPGEERNRWEKGFKTIKEAVNQHMWDPEEEMFFDVDPGTGRRTGVKAAVCFYPYMTDMVGEEHLQGLRRHLLNPGEFWTPFPVPATALTDAAFSAEALWKDRRMNCPWNGRVWPMTNSHLAECLARTALRLDAEFRSITAEFIRTFIRMMFFDGDATRPNSFEHYHPFTGRPSLYRGVDDYQHSWVVDLILKYVAGIRPGETSVIVDPFPFRLKALHVTNLTVRGHRLEVRLKNESFSVTVDDGPGQESVLGKPVELPI